jgi:8-oxo-dGTP diphosphatase
MEWVDCVAFMLFENSQVLAERRKLTKTIEPGILALPGGHCEDGETLQESLLRELKEELDIIPHGFRYVCTLLHKSKEYRKLHYYAIESWQGAIQNQEAESLYWVSISQLDMLDLHVDQQAVKEYLRIYHHQRSKVC